MQPEFPREALQARVDRGQVRARLTVDASGNVARVEVLASQPGQVFDRAVVRALSQWKFIGGTEGRTMDTEIAFHRWSRRCRGPRIAGRCHAGPRCGMQHPGFYCRMRERKQRTSRRPSGTRRGNPATQITEEKFA